MQKTNSIYDIVIIGNGLVGASLALALSHSKLRIAIVESETGDHSAKATK